MVFSQCIQLLFDFPDKVEFLSRLQKKFRRVIVIIFVGYPL